METLKLVGDNIETTISTPKNEILKSLLQAKEFEQAHLNATQKHIDVINMQLEELKKQGLDIDIKL